MRMGLFEDVHVLSHHNSAVIAGVFNLGGAHALFNYIVITLNSNGMIDQIMNLNQYGFVELQDKQMIIHDVIKRYVFQIADNEITQSFYTRVQKGASDDILAFVRDGQISIPEVKDYSYWIHYFYPARDYQSDRNYRSNIVSNNILFNFSGTIMKHILHVILGISFLLSSSSLMNGKNLYLIKTVVN